jgi:hypothetical protein
MGEGVRSRFSLSDFIVMVQITRTRQAAGRVRCGPVRQQWSKHRVKPSANADRVPDLDRSRVKFHALLRQPAATRVGQLHRKAVRLRHVCPRSLPCADDRETVPAFESDLVTLAGVPTSFLPTIDDWPYRNASCPRRMA